MQPNPDPKPCQTPRCDHSRGKHKHKHGRGQSTNYSYGACRVPGCRCQGYQAPDPEPRMHYVELPSGGTATVSEDVSAETIQALDQMTQAAVRSFNRQIDHAALTGEIPGGTQ